jgi:hypothetical protein
VEDARSVALSLLGEFAIVERGVVVGGLMICGSFLLAAMLNRSAMEERPATAVPIKAVVPVAPPAVQPAATPAGADCNEASARADAHDSAAEAEAPQSGLMVNGREPCPR